MYPPNRPPGRCPTPGFGLSAINWHIRHSYYIGLDVHKETIAIAYALGGSRDDALYHGQCGGSVLAAEMALRKLAEKLEVEFRDLKVCYEAGPTGFVLARRLIRYGLACILMSPSKTERKPNSV